MEQNYQLELKHLAARVSAAVLQEKQVWNQQAVFCLWISQGWQLRRGWTGGKESLFLQTPPLPEQEKGISEWKESEQSQGLLPEPRWRHSCSIQLPKPEPHQGELRRKMILYKSAPHPKTLCLHCTRCKNLKHPKHVKMFQSNLSLSRTLWSLS